MAKAYLKDPLTFPLLIKPTGKQPLDDRTTVPTVQDLIASDTFGTSYYKGMPVTIQNTGEIYVLIDDTNVTSINSWKKIATEDSLAQAVKDLGPVFKFKGIATAIDPDHTTLTIGSGSIGIPVEEPTTSEKLISYGTVLQKNLDSVKYAWGTSEYPNLFFTDDLYTTKNIGQNQYKKGAEKELQYINVFDTLYFQNGTQLIDVEGSSTNETRNYIIWEALDDGGTLYSLSKGNTLDIYTVTSSSTLPDPLVTGITSTIYKYYEFIPLTTKYVVTINSQMESITASSANNGHVYQLGEEEYASNGNMWVQLGSPKTDWIVL